MAKKKFKPYEVKVKTWLSIKSDAGLEYEKIGIAKPDNYTILEEKNGFGRIEKGWISLRKEFVEKVGVK